MSDPKRDERDDAVVEPEEDLALTRGGDGEVRVDDAALGDWSTNPDWTAGDAPGVDRAGEEPDEA